jgi:ferritin-like metal-binding protein YciE
MEPLLNLRDLLQHQVDDLYSAEEQIIEALPKMIEKASDRELKSALTEHLRVTNEQKNRLDKVQSLLKQGNTEDDGKQKGFLQRMFGSGTKCKGTAGLIKEGEKMMGEKMDPSVMDAAIIASAQKIEHYEISGYGTARAYAQQLAFNEVATLLETSLNEEYNSDDLLTRLALSKVNLEAQQTKGNGIKSSGVGVRNGLTKTKSSPAPAKKAAPKKSIAKKAVAKKAAPKKAMVKRTR